ELLVVAEKGCGELQALLAVGDDLRRLSGAAGDRHAGGVLDRPGISLRENGSFGGPASALSGAKSEGEGLPSGETLRPRSGPHAATENVITVMSSRAARLRRRVRAEAARLAA